jgi:hypothetical protein
MGGRTVTLKFALAGALVALAGAGAPAVPAAALPSAFPTPPFAFTGTDKPLAGAAHRVTAIEWRRTASAGATVLVSAAYADPAALGRTWSDFFASLIHGDELARLTAYVATPSELSGICGSDAAGCYAANRLYVSNDPVGGIPPTEVAAHEYGHHVAFNRSNSPWPAIDWGTKRWATAINVCPRVAASTAFPGDENQNYTLNPGEAFAETYRVLNGYGVDDWFVVDPSFRPTPEALAAVRADVVDPWSTNTGQTIRVRFAKRQRVWTQTLRTPLDGNLSVTSPVGAVDLRLLADDGKTVLVDGSWTSSGGKSIDYRVCGRRDFVLRIARAAAVRATFLLRVSAP